MNPVIRNILAVMAGIIAGSAVNMGIVMISGYIIPPPDGADISSMKGLEESLHLFQPRHYLMPFLAHALGTFVGAFLAAFIAANHRMVFAISIGAFFLAGGIANSLMLPSPSWFTMLDLACAYLPMAYLAWKSVPEKA